MSALRRIQGVAEQLEHQGVKYDDPALGDAARELAAAVDELSQATFARLEAFAGYAHPDYAAVVSDELASFRQEVDQNSPRLGAVNPVTQPADPNPVARHEDPVEEAPARESASHSKSSSKK